MRQSRGTHDRPIRAWTVPLVGALVVLAVVLAGCAGGSGLTSGTWQWTASTTTLPASQSVVPDPSLYTLTFKSDGTIAVKSDCNSASGTYTTSGASMSITLGPTTLAICGSDSLDQAFRTSLALVGTYEQNGSSLTLTFKANAGTMTFKQA
ncbi:MAG: META domain-containing protein [Candidatus Limnocylindrales bacterium]